MKRVLCVWLPDFPIQRLHAERPAIRSAACVLYTRSGDRAQVVIASGEAARHGIRPGMPLAEAQALVESAAFILHDVNADAQELNSLACSCCRYSPVVGQELSSNTHCLVLDISGCSHLFDGESGLVRQLVVDLAERGYFAHVATAGTTGAAWAIARYGHVAGTDRRLRSLPVEALRIPHRLAAQLREFDLKTIGQLSALPKDALPSRFGTVLTERLDQLYGRQDELIVPVSRREPVIATWTTEESINCRQATRYVCPDLLSDILKTLKSRGEGLLKLVLQFESETGIGTAVEVGLARPADSHSHILKLLELKLETLAASDRIQTVHMEASAVSLLPIRQQNLFAAQESEDGEVRRLFDRISARLGTDAIVRPVLLPDSVPEQAVRYAPLTTLTTDTCSVDGPGFTASRPLLLLSPPERLHDVSSSTNGEPLSFHWSGGHYRVASCTQAERIATGWWQDTGSIYRDYFRVETGSGARLWLFRDRHDTWFLHGIFE